MSKIALNHGREKLIIKILVVAIISILIIFAALGKFTYNVSPYSYYKMNTEEKDMVREIHDLEKEYSKIQKRIKQQTEEYLIAWSDYSYYTNGHSSPSSKPNSNKNAAINRYGDAIKKSRELFTEEEKLFKELAELKSKINK